MDETHENKREKIDKDFKNRGGGVLKRIRRNFEEGKVRRNIEGEEEWKKRKKNTVQSRSNIVLFIFLPSFRIDFCESLIYQDSLTNVGNNSAYILYIIYIYT